MTDADLMRREDLGRAAALTPAFLERERWSREQLAHHQRAALRDLVAHAVAGSPFYREHYAGLGPDTPLEALPVVEKPEIMARWDDVVTDPRLRLEEARAHLANVRGDDYFKDEFRIVATGGSSRIPGIFAFGRESWAHVGALMIRAQVTASATSAGSGDRLAMIGPVEAFRTITSRVGVLLSLADPHPEDTLRIDITRPVAELVASLNEFCPARLIGYPSIVALLAAEQLDGRLQISPRSITTSSEPQTPAMHERIHAAWGITPHDLWGVTEASGVLGIDCAEHRGLHLNEDACIVEVVDEANRPVADGQIGSRILLTNLVNPTMPLIRYVVTDRVAVTSEPCPCGRTTRLVSTLDGRTDDVLRFPAAAGGTVDVHPLAWSPLAADPAVAEFRVRHDDDALHVDVVLRSGAPPDAAEPVVHQLLESQGVSPEQRVVVRAHDHLPRSGQGKLKLVETSRQRTDAR